MLFQVMQYEDKLYPVLASFVFFNFFLSCSLSQDSTKYGGKTLDPCCPFILHIKFNSNILALIKLFLL